MGFNITAIDHRSLEGKLLRQKILYHKENMTGLTDADLRDIMMDSYQRAKEMDEQRIAFNPFSTGIELNKGVAAQEILQERRGRNYVLNLIGYREPRTVRERLAYHFRGDLPRLGV